MTRVNRLGICHNTLSKAIPSDREVDISVSAIKNIIAILNHCVKSEDPAKQHRFCSPVENSWCKWRQDKASYIHPVLSISFEVDVSTGKVGGSVLFERRRRELPRVVWGHAPAENFEI